MPRTTGQTVMALLAGVALVGAAAQADAASATSPATSPVVLDNVALDSVTAGNGYQVFGQTVVDAGAVGGTRASAEVDYAVKGTGGPSSGGVLGIGGALGIGLGDGADAESFSGSFGGGDIVYANRFGKRYDGIGLAIDFSASVVVAYSMAPLSMGVGMEPLKMGVGPLAVPFNVR